MTSGETYRHLKSGETLYKQGEAADLIYLITKGEIVVQSQTSSASFSEGDVIGMFDVVLRGVYSKTAVAKGAAQVQVASASKDFAAIEGTMVQKLFYSFLQSVDSEKAGYWS